MKRAAALAALLCALSARAQRYDPDYRWLTLSTDRFDVHFHQGSYRLALKVARAAEQAHALLAPLLGHAPMERTQIVLADDADDANGAATALPRPAMWLQAPAPDPRSTLGDTDDHLWLLVAHEYTHVLHLDTAGGLPGLVNQVFGKVLLPNAMFLPGWVQEGLAVFQESNLSSAGRLRSSQEEMVLRMNVLEGVEFPLDRLSHLPLTWPRGGARYLYGGRFLQFVAQQRGEEALLRFSHEYGARALPYFVNSAAERAAGLRFDELYARWQDRLREEYRAQAERIRAEGLTPFRLLTASGENTGNPRWGGGRIFYVRTTGHAWSALRAVDVAGADVEVARVNGEARIAPSADGAVVYLTELDTVREFRVYEDLSRVAVAEGRKERLTRGARLTEPDLAPDGRALLAVQRRDGGETALVLVQAEGGAPRLVYRPPAIARVATPRFAPDGRHAAFVEHGEGWDVRLLDLATGQARTVAGGPGQQIEPAFTADGRALYFASDRGGVYNLWRLEFPEGPSGPAASPCRVTNVLGGAFAPAPSPDGSQVAFLSYGARGFDVALAERGALGCRPDGPPDPPRPPPVFAEPDALYPVRPYDPLSTLAPRAWLPMAFGALDELAVGAFTSGADVVGLHAWQAALWWRVQEREPGFSLSYATQISRPTLSLSASRDLRWAPGAGSAYRERTTAFSASTGVSFSSVESAHVLRLGYTLEALTPLDSAGAASLPPDDGRVGEVFFNWTFRSARRFALSISGEEGRVLSVGATVGSRLLAGTFDHQRLSASWAEYLRLPWAEHHALALRIVGGLSRGDLGRRHALALGGPRDRPGALDALLHGVPDPSLRGYPPGALGGDTLVLGTLEYRLPLVDVDRGLWLLPLALRRVHGAAFVDAGDAWSRADRGPRVHLGAGAELRLELVLGYGGLAQVRTGYARGLSQGGDHQIYYGFGGSF